MTTGFRFTTQASQMLEEKDLSTNPFLTLSVYERKQSHGYWEKAISWQAPELFMLSWKRQSGTSSHPSCFSCSVSEAPVLTLPLWWLPLSFAFLIRLITSLTHPARTEYLPFQCARKVCSEQHWSFHYHSVLLNFLFIFQVKLHPRPHQ